MEGREVISLPPGIRWILHSDSGAMSCRTDGAVLPADKPAVRATALAAMVSRMEVQVLIDTSLPRISGFCQVALLSLMPG